MARRNPGSPNANQPRYLDPAVLQKIQPLSLAAREVVEGVRVGMHKSPLRGFSTEFAQHRQYVPGDELRHVDWRVYARSGRYYVKLFEAETNFNANMLLDASSSMHFGGPRAEGGGSMTKLEYAKYLAASLAHLIVEQRDSVGLGVFDSELRQYIEPKSTMSVIQHIAEQLEVVDAQPRTDVAAVLHDFARRMPRRGFVVLFSDLLDNVDAFLQGINHLRYRGHNVIVFHVLDPHELTFPYTGTCRFEGLELDGSMVTQPQRIRAAYMQELEAFLTRVRLACERSRVDYVLADTSRPIEATLTGYLIARQRTVS
ncbi:MAG: DUF58 domain-containing protein [Phycisphaeraceae bacterium]